MSEEQVPKVPINRSKWKAEASRKSVVSTSIYQLPPTSLASGSKVSGKQFLALRTVWKTKKASDFKPSEWGITALSPALLELSTHPSWEKYAKCLEGGWPSTTPLVPVPDLGSLSLAWYNQQKVRRAERDDSVPVGAKIIFTRSQNKKPAPVSSFQDRMKGLSLAENEQEQSSDGEEQGQEPSPWQFTKLSPMSPATSETALTIFPATKDEQMVNMCLIEFLMALSFHSKTIKAEWSIERKSFRLGQPSLYEARTDGYLGLSVEGRGLVTKAIIEVKPCIRAAAKGIHYQETAQMAAWIFSEPDEEPGLPLYRYGLLPFFCPPPRSCFY